MWIRKIQGDIIFRKNPLYLPNCYSYPTLFYLLIQRCMENHSEIFSLKYYVRKGCHVHIYTYMTAYVHIYTLFGDIYLTKGDFDFGRNVCVCGGGNFRLLKKHFLNFFFACNCPVVWLCSCWPVISFSWKNVTPQKSVL